MPDTLTYAYAADITKAERDGDALMVYGKATSSDLDLDEQVCDPEWLRSAMPEWQKWGNLREMHQPIVAGIGRELIAKGDDWWLKSEVIDAGTARKIESGALKGYSVGIKNARVVKDDAAPGGRIVGGTIVEVSYVDRPCNPTATLTIAKAAGPGFVAMGVPSPKILARKAVTPDGDVDEAPDIAGAKAAIDQVCDLMISEITEIKAGNCDETEDVRVLLCTLERLVCFMQNETGEGDQVTFAGLAAYADKLKDALSGKEVNDLPDSAFAHIEAGGKKDEEGKTTPRSKRHFPVHDAAHVRNALARAPQSPFGDKAMPKIKAAAKKFGVEVSDKAADTDKAAAIEADLVKAAVHDAAVAELDKLKAAAITQADLVKAAVRERDAAVAELDKLKATPLPAAVSVTGKTADRKSPLAAKYRELAKSVSDRELALGYEKLAAAAEST